MIRWHDPNIGPGLDLHKYKMASNNKYVHYTRRAKTGLNAFLKENIQIIVFKSLQAETNGWNVMPVNIYKSISLCFKKLYG